MALLYVITFPNASFLRLSNELYTTNHSGTFHGRDFIPGRSPIQNLRENEDR